MTQTAILPQLLTLTAQAVLAANAVSDIAKMNTTPFGKR